MPVHTIVWAKELYKLLFHSKVEESMLYEDPSGEEPSTYMASVEGLRKLLEGGSLEGEETPSLSKAVEDLLDKLYVAEIQKQLG